MTRIAQLGSIDSNSSRYRRLSGRRRFVGIRPWLDGLEERTLLSTITWDSADHPTGGDWDTGRNWIGGVSPGPNDDAVINLTSAGTVTLGSDFADEVHSVTTNANTSLSVNNGSLSLGGGSSTLDGPVTVEQGAALNVGGGGSSLLLESTLNANGALNFGTADTVSFYGAQIAVNVNGTMTAMSGDSFTNLGYTNSISINSGGELAANSSTFDLTNLSLDNNSILKSTDLTNDVFEMPISVPYNDVQYLANNATFNDVDINPGTLSSGTLNLDQIGTASSLRYVLPGLFTVASGTTLNVADNMKVLLESTLTDDGALNFGTDDTVSFYGAQIAVNVNGTMTATSGDSFTNLGYTNSISINSGGELAASSCTFDLSYLSLDNKSILKSTDLTNDVFEMTIDVPYNDVQYLSGNLTFNDVDINAGSLSSGSLNLNQIGTASSLRYVLPGLFTVESGTTLNVAANMNVLLESTLTDNGALNFGTDDTVSFYGAQIAVNVNGTMTATSGDSFTNLGYTNSISINAGGELAASSCTFDLSYLSFDNNSILNSTDLTNDVFEMPIDVPSSDVQYLGNNATFNDVDINAGTVSSGTVNLDQIGTASSLRYVFPGLFTVASGATLTVAANINVLLESTLTDNGALSFGNYDNVSFYGAQIVVGVNGTMTATSGDSFANVGYTNSMTVNSGGQLNMGGTTYGLASLTLNAGSSATIHFNVFSSQLAINSDTTINISGNDFSNVGANGIIATGDASSHIPLENNYWGTTDPTAIGKLILDHNDDGSRPTVDFQPDWANNSGTLASPASALFSPTDQTIPLTAVVSTVSGTPITGGTETFTIFNGNVMVGQSTIPESVSQGTVTGSYTLPGGTAVGSYTIQASYSGDGTYPASTDSSQLLTVSPAASQVAITSAPLALVAGGNGQVTVELEDTNGNPAISASNQTISLDTTSTAGAFYATQGGTTPITNIVIPAGQTSASVYYTDTKAGTPTLTVSDGALNSSPTQIETVNPAIASTFTVTTSLASPDTAGTVGTVTVTAIDQYSNVVASGPNQYEGAVNMSSTDSRETGLPTSYTFTAADAGSHTFTDAILKTAGSQTITATDSGTSTITGSVSVTVVPAAASQVVITSTPQNLVAGSRGSVTVQLEDAYDNPGAVSTSAQTINLSTTSTAGAFYATQNSSTPITSVVIPVGQSSASFYYGDTTAGTPTVTVSDSAVGPATTQQETITPAAASQVAITSPPLSIAAGSPGQITVQLEDMYGNPGATSTNSQTISLSTTSTTGAFYMTQGGTTPITSVVIAAGSISASFYYTDTTDGNPTVTVTDSAFNSSSSQVETITSATASKVVITSNALSLIAGNRGSVTVQLEDSNGNPATSKSAQTIALVTTSADGVFYATQGSSTPITSIVIPAGQSSGSFYYGDTKAGTPTVKASDTAFNPPSTSTQVETVYPAVAESFTITTSFANPDPAGSEGTVTVSALDTYNNVVGSGPDQYLGTVSLSSTDSQVTGLPPSYTFTVADAGSHTFTNVALEIAGKQTFTATDSVTSTITGTSGQVNVVPVKAAAIHITTRPPGGVIAGKNFSITVNADDPYGNLDTSFNGMVSVALANGSSGTLTGTLTMMATAGVAVFGNLADTTSGSISINATSANLTGDTASNIPVNPAPANHFVVTTSFASQDVAGTVGTVTVAEADPFGNIESSGPNQYLGTVNLFSTDSRETGLPASYTFTAGDAGSHTFAGVILKTAGNQTITATDSGDSTITGSVSVLVIPAPASQVVITSSALNLIAGGRGSVAFQLEDAYDNMGAVSTSAQTINLSTTSTAGAFFATESGTSPITSVVIPVGQSSASFYYSDTKAGTPTVTTADSGLSSSPTQLETVNPAPVNDFVVTTSFANPDVAGTTGTVTVTAEDQYTNIVGSGPNLYLGSVELSNTDTKATGLPASYTFTAGDAGSHTFDNVVLKTAGTQTITATDSITHAITGNITVDVVPAKVLDLAVTTSFTNPDVAGTVGTVTVTAQDAFSNPVSSGPNQYTGTVDLTSTDVLAAGLPASFTITDIDAGSHTFNNVILKTAGTQTITATDSAINTITGSAMVIVVPAAGDQMVITSPPRTLVAGARGQILVEFEDTYHNLGASSTSAQTVNLGTTSAAGVFYATQSSNTPITSFVISVGQTGASVYYSDTKTGTPTVTTSDSAFRSSPTQMESENPAIVHDFVVTTSFPNPDVAGTTGNVTVTAKDQYGNTVGSGPNEYEGTVKLVSTDGQAAGVPASLIFTVADGGSTTLPGVVLKTAGPETITAADSVTTTISGSATIDVTAATVTHLVVTTPPPNPIVPGQPFSVGISAEDAFGNVASSFNEGVTISLGNDPAFTTTLQPTNGVAMFTGLTASAADQGSAITAVASGLPPIMTPPIPISPTPTIVHDQVLTMQKTNNKGKKVGKPVFEGFTFVFSGAMNPTTAGANADYHVDYKVITRGKKKSATKYNPVSFRPSYNPATNTVTLFVKSTKPFAKGGQITISGVTDQAGTALDASDTVFTITPNAKDITRG